MRQVILNGEKIKAMRGERWFYEIAASSRYRLSPGAIRRATSGLPVALSLARHLAEAIGADLADLVVREVEVDLSGRR